jgi:hypothetical protein
MFNLIVSGDLNDERRGSIPANRVFEHTDPLIAAKLMPDGCLDIAMVKSFPTIFMTEGVGDEVVFIGWLSQIELRSAEYSIQYICDRDFPSLTNSQIYTMAKDLQIDSWEFSRNHWAVKNIDLFEILYRHSMKHRNLPNVFQISSNPVRSRLISLMMPFSAEFDGIYEAIKSALEAETYQCQRADNFWLHDHIMQDIVELICISNVIICDLSSKNSNVFYEAGIAHTLGKEVIFITQNLEDVPFDLRALRCIIYLNNQEGRAKLAKDVLSRIATVI